MACTTRRPKYSWGSGRRAASQRRCLSPQRGTFAQPRRVLDKTRQASRRRSPLRPSPSPFSPQPYQLRFLFPPPPLVLPRQVPKGRDEGSDRAVMARGPPARTIHARARARARAKSQEQEHTRDALGPWPCSTTAPRPAAASQGVPKKEKSDVPTYCLLF
jgi:hypothetical protein